MEDNSSVTRIEFPFFSSEKSEELRGDRLVFILPALVLSEPVLLMRSVSCCDGDGRLLFAEFCFNTVIDLPRKESFIVCH